MPLVDLRGRAQFHFLSVKNLSRGRESGKAVRGRHRSNKARRRRVMGRDRKNRSNRIRRREGPIKRPRINKRSTTGSLSCIIKRRGSMALITRVRATMASECLTFFSAAPCQPISTMQTWTLPVLASFRYHIPPAHPLILARNG